MLVVYNGATEELQIAAHDNEAGVASNECNCALGIWETRTRHQVWPTDLKHHERYFVLELITRS